MVRLSIHIKAQLWMQYAVYCDENTNDSDAALISPNPHVEFSEARRFKTRVAKPLLKVADTNGVPAKSAQEQQQTFRRRFSEMLAGETKPFAQLVGKKGLHSSSRE